MSHLIYNENSGLRGNLFDYYSGILFSYYLQYEEDGIHWSFNPLADFDTFMNEHYRISKSERQKMFNESLSALGLKKENTSVN